LEGIATLHGISSLFGLPIIEVVDLVWKGLRLEKKAFAEKMVRVLKSLTWFGRDCDMIG